MFPTVVRIKLHVAGLCSQRIQLCTKIANIKPTKHSRLCSLRENLFRLRSGLEKVAALNYPGAKISLEEEYVPTLFPVVEAMLMPSIRRTQAATQASTTTVHLSARCIQVMSANGGFGPVNSDSNLWRVRPATVVTSKRVCSGPQLW